MKQMTSDTFSTDSDAIITRIFDGRFTTKPIEVSRDDDMMTKVICFFLNCN